ncbi:MAG: hypothetical protein V4577_05265 [Bacteroidota bacterium]
MEPEFITYQKFNDAALAKQLAELLAEHSISYFIEEGDMVFNPAFSYTDKKEYAVKVKPGDFERINDLLKQDANETMGEVEPDYYLLAFTNEELMDVVTKADEWNVFDVQLARKLLAERGHAISDKEAAEIEEERIEELKKPEPSQNGWVIIGYIIAIGCLAMPFFISVIGLFIGWHLASHKKTLPNGEQIYAYNETDRKHGKRIFYIGIAVFLITLGILIYGAFFPKQYYEN